MPRNNCQHANRGAITRIRLENFMTYDSLDVLPGPNLNMVIGPNGTGKSSIVCCIIVGLAGEVSLTGRGGSPADFVKRGKDSCITEIELFNDSGENYVIQREIIITNRSHRKLEHKSEWKINGSKANKSQVQSLTKELNIKVDNLCQFLPQDSVTQFVKMNTGELLMNTLKAAGDNNLVEDHTKLVESTKEIDAKLQALQTLEQSCKENEVNAKRLEAEVSILKEREKLVKLKNYCVQKIEYVRYLEGKKNCAKAKDDCNKLKENLRRVENSSQPFKDTEELFEKKFRDYKQLIETSNRTLPSFDENISKATNEIDDCKKACQIEFAKFKSKLEQERNRESNLKMKHQELKSLEDNLRETEDVDYTPQLRNIEADIDQVKQGRIEVSRKKAFIEERRANIVRNIEDLKNESQLIQEMKQKKATHLRSKNADAWQVMEWLSKNEDKFQKKVFNPVMVEINVKNNKFARYVEQAIPRNELFAFVCQTVDDVKLLTKTVREFLKLKINVILAPDKTLQEFEDDARNNNRNLSSLGVRHHYLKDLVEAPEPVLRYLCGNNNFHRIPVFEDCPEIHLRKLIEILPRFYANDEIFIINKSRYDGQKITARDYVRPPTHLTYFLDPQRIIEHKQRFQQYQAEREKCEADLNSNLEEDDRLKSKWQDLVEKHRHMKTKHEQKKKLENYIKRLRETIKQIEEEKVDIEAERRFLRKSIESINLKMMDCLKKLTENTQDSVKFRRVHMLNLILCRLAQRNHRLARKKYRDSIKNAERLKESIRKSEQELTTFKNALESLRENAKEVIPGFNDGKLDSRLQHRFDSIEENTLEELKTRRDGLTVRIERISNASNNDVLSEFRRQNDEMRDKLVRIEELKRSIKLISTARDKIKQTWLPSVKEVIDVINTNYAEFMRKLCYDGQVRLDFDTTKPEDFSVYGISILVRYRDNEQLIPLSSTRQSGGERSVATMIYMLALQTKTTAPFRCVDEINQGMDKENERKVFELLVKTADSSSSQYFLVSPKLLSDLPYSEKMMIHMTYNGPKLRVDWNKSLSK